MDTVTLLMLFASTTQTFDLPKGLIDAVCFVESKHKTSALNNNDGGTPSIGICQIKLATAKGLGFKGTSEELRKPQVNIYYAAKYLKAQLNRYSNHINQGVAAYNAGTCRTGKNGLPRNQKYVTKVFTAWSYYRQGYYASNSRPVSY